MTEGLHQSSVLSENGEGGEVTGVWGKGLWRKEGGVDNPDHMAFDRGMRDPRMGGGHYQGPVGTWLSLIIIMNRQANILHALPSALFPKIWDVLPW